MVPNLLKKIGLSDRDAAVYIACLELGTQPASLIAKHAGIKRASAYFILDTLVRLGLITAYNGAGMKYFSAVSPEYLITFIEKQKQKLTTHQKELQAYLPYLTDLMHTSTVKPKVRFYEGFEGVERVMNETLTSHEEVCGYVTIDAWFSLKETRDYIRWYARQRSVVKKVPLRSIVTDTPLARQYLQEQHPDKNYNYECSHFRWLPSDIKIVSNEINIYDNKLAIVCISKRELLGVIIESESIVQTQKAIFELAWRAATPGIWDAKFQKCE